MNISVKKFSKKSLSLLIALIMVFSALPLTPPISADAATMSETLLNDRHGLVTNGSDSRMKNSNKQYQIVNDQKENNTNAGVLHFDLSKYSNKKIESVQFNAKLDSSTGDSQISNMNFYYSTTLKGKDSTYLASGGKETLNTKIGYGSGTTANEKYLNHLIGHYDENSDRLFQIDYKEQNPTSQKNKDVTEEIKQIILSGKTDLYIIVMHSNAGGANSTNGWSDALISPANINFTVTYSDYDFSNPTQAKDYIDSRINGFVMPTAQSVTCNGTDLNLSNVLYTSNTYLENSLTEFSLNQKTNDTKMSARLMSPSNRIVYMYTGNKSIVKVPLFFEAQKNSSVLQRYKVNYVCSASSNWTIDNENWIRTTAYNKWDTNSAGTRDGEYKVSSSSTHNAPDFNANNRPEGVDGTTDFRNLVTYNGTLTFSNNYFQISELPKVDMSFDGFCYWYDRGAQYSYQNNITKNTTGLGKALSTISLANTASYLVIDFSGYNALVSNNTMKNKYNTVKANETNYTDDSLLAYYKAVANLIKFKTASYDLSTDNGVSSCASNLATVVNNYNKAERELAQKTITVQFVNYDGYTVKRAILNPGEAIGEFPANTASTPDEYGYADIYHYKYTWNTTLTAESVPTSDVTISENASLETHSSTTPATCISKARCSACGAEYGSLGKHSYKLETNYQVPTNFEENPYKRSMCIYNCGTEDINGREYMDVSSYWETYNAQLTQSQDKIENTAKYTSDSIKAVQDIIDDVAPVKDSPTKSQRYIQDKTRALATATNSLVLRQYSITVKYVDELGNDLKVGEEGATSKIYPAVDYGSILNVVAPTNYNKVDYAVYKWTRNGTDGDIISGLNSSSLDVVVKGASTYYVFLKNTSVDDTKVGKNAVITLNNKSGNIVDIGYVPMNQNGTETTATVTVDTNAGTIKIGDATLTAPKYSFYNLIGFEIGGIRVASGQTITLNSKMVIRPVYKAKQTVRITRATGSNFLINEQDVPSIDVEWNKKIVMTYNGAVPDSQVVIWKDGNGNVLAQGTTYTFYSNSNVTISASVEASAPAVPSASIGMFSYDPTDNKVTVVNNFYVPDGMKATKAGVILSTKNSTREALIAQTNGKFEGDESQFTTDKNQIRISVSRTANTEFTMYALAYVVVKDEYGTENTYYAPTVQSITYTVTNS